MRRQRISEEPGLWRLTHDVDDARSSFTLNIFPSPGIAARTIKIVANGAVLVDGKPVMSANTPPVRRPPRTPRVDVTQEEIRLVAQEVSEVTGVRVQAMQGPLRKARINRARKVAMFLASRRLAGATHEEIGSFFGRSRSTTTNLISQVEEQVRLAIERLEREDVPQEETHQLAVVIDPVTEEPLFVPVDNKS